MVALPSASPVASIPRIPGLPIVGNFMKFRSDRLGLQDDAARIGPLACIQLFHIPLYVVTDADLAHAVLVDQAAAFRKSPALQFLRPMLGDGLITSEGATHKRRRKLLAPAFAPKRLAAYGETMVAETRRQMARWRTGDRIDLGKEMMELTLAIAGRTMFGADVRGDARQVAHGLELGMRSQIANLKSIVRLGYDWPLPRHRKMRRAVALLDEVVYRLIAEGRARGTDQGDVLSILLLARDEDDGSGLADAEIRDEVMTLLLAGHETTANALTWAWYELARHPAALDRLRAELAPLGDREVTTDDLPALPWNLAVLEEAMRLHPPVYVTSRQATEPVTLGGHQLPTGAIVLINIRGMHRRADYYPDPFVFRPERFMPDAKKTRPRDQYMPFGAGPRVCIGAHFAMLEGQLALATMARATRFKLLATNVEAEPLVTLRPRGGLPVIVERPS